MTSETGYPYDEQVRERVTQLLYAALPELYRIRDRQADGAPGDLQQFMEVLAAPLAALRQNVDELHADLFVDTCREWVLPYLARMVGTELVFPDADSNRRDVRRTVEWRRRKGTPDALGEMVDELSGHLGVLQEGWQRLQITQDINLIRPERVVADISDPTLREQASGPLDAVAHALDARPISHHTGRYHPEAITFWTHLTRTFPLREAPAAELEQTGHPFRLYAFDTLGALAPLRMRATGPDDEIGTDRILPMHFDENPGAYFDRDGRFSVRLGGVPAAIASPRMDGSRTASRHLIEAAFVEASVSADILKAPDSRLSGGVDLEVLAVSQDADPTALQPEDTTVRATVSFAPQRHSVSPGASDKLERPVCLLRLRSNASRAFFPGAVVQLVGDALACRCASTEEALAAEGFLRGAVFAELPETWIDHEQLYWLAADGSLFDAGQSVAVALAGLKQLGAGGGVSSPMGEDASFPDVPDGERAVTTGPGASWPAGEMSARRDPLGEMLPAHGRGPVWMHGGPVLIQTDDGLESADATTEAALVYAARYSGEGEVVYEPMIELGWIGPTPASGAELAWVAASGAQGALEVVEPSARFEQLWELVDANRADLVVRFECSDERALLAPCEVSYTSADGRSLLVYLPQFDCNDAAREEWGTDRGASPTAVVFEDGSTFWESTQAARYSHGQVAPLGSSVPLRRREVVYRNLGAFDCGVALAPCAADRLQVDPERGLFALSEYEALPVYPSPVYLSAGDEPAPEQAFSPAVVSVDCQVGFSDHTGALPSMRQPAVDRALARPTRLVCKAGALGSNRPHDWVTIPRYASLSDALEAIAADASADGSMVVTQSEVIQFEDSAHYREELTWPGNVSELTIQAAEGERPVVELLADTQGTEVEYDAMSWLGIMLYRHSESGGPVSIDLPVCAKLTVEFVTVLGEHAELVVRLGEQPRHALVQRCVLGTLTSPSQGTLQVVDSLIGSVVGEGITAPELTVAIEQATVFGASTVFVLEASNTIFVDPIEVADRFEGCIRYSHAPETSGLPRKHRVDHDAAIRLVSRDRRRAAYGRLASDCARVLDSGADDGSEMGVFHRLQIKKRREGLIRRLNESTPAGLRPGFLRID